MSRIILSFVFILLSTSSLSADAGNVLFSYQKVEIGTKADWVLVPVPTDSLKGVASKNTITSAFNALKKAKRSTYGASKLTISGSSPASARVSIAIPQRNMPYAVIIIAETVYTLTEMGVTGVSFPGYTSKVLKRKDVPFAAYSLIMPLWKVLPNVKSKSIQVQLPDGTIASSFDVIKAWSSKTPKIRKQVYSYLKSSDPYTVGTVAKLLPTLGLPFVDKVLPLLNHKTESIRKTALTILEAKRNEDKVLSAVLRVMQKDKSQKIVVQAADFLSKSKNSKYSVQMTYYLLNKGTEKQAIEAIAVLGKSKTTPETVKILNEKISDKKTTIASAAVDALSKLKEDKVLTKALDNQKIKPITKIQIATRLSEKSANTKVTGLKYLAQNANNDLALDAIVKLGATPNDSARIALEALLKKSKSERQLAALEELAKRKNISSLPAIASMIKSFPRKTDAAGYRIMTAQKTNVISGQTKSSNKFTQRLAYRAFGEKAAKEGKSAKIFSILKTGAKNSDAGIRGASARAIGRYANKDAETVLKGMLKDRDNAVRADVAYAIGFLKEGVLTDELTKMLADKNTAVQAGAISALGRRGETFAWDKIKKLSSSNDEGVRAASLTALGNLISRDDQRGVRDVISMLSGRVSDKSKFVQEAAIVQLGTFKDESAVTAIALRLNDEHEPLQLAAIRALGATKHGSATELLVNMLDDTNRRVRLTTIETLVKLKDRSAKKGIQNRIKIEKDLDVKNALQKGLKSL